MLEKASSGSFPLRSITSLVNSWSWPKCSTESVKAFQPIIAEKCRYGSPCLFLTVSELKILVEATLTQRQ
jgi:hypothetical protein